MYDIVCHILKMNTIYTRYTSIRNFVEISTRRGGALVGVDFRVNSLYGSTSKCMQLLEKRCVFVHSTIAVLQGLCAMLGRDQIRVEQFAALRLLVWKQLL